MAKGAKRRASDWMSKYVRLRDAIDYCLKYGIDLRQFNRPEDIICGCCTCGKVMAWILGDAGHFIPRGMGGGSGVYFDARNVHFQCRSPCNRFRQGASLEYEDFMREKYGQDVIDELRRKDKLVQKKRYFVWEVFYKEQYAEQLKRLERILEGEMI